MKTCAQYIAEAKAALGNPAMSDRELGVRLGGEKPFLQGNITRSKSGTMPDTIAIALAKAIGIPPGEVLNVARLERETNEVTRSYLSEWLSSAMSRTKLPKPAPDVVIRGGVKVVVSTPDQGWRKRSLPMLKARQLERSHA